MMKRIKRVARTPWGLGLLLLVASLGAVTAWRMIVASTMVYVPLDFNSWLVAIIAVTGLACSRVTFGRMPKRRRVRQRMADRRVLRAYAMLDDFGRPVA